MTVQVEGDFDLHRFFISFWLMRTFDVERLHYLGIDMFTHFIGNTVDEMDEDTFSKYMKYHLYICQRADMVGTTNHILDIFRKE